MKKISGQQFLVLIFILLSCTNLFAQQADKLLTLKDNTLTGQQFIRQIQSQLHLEFTFNDKVDELLKKNVTVRKKKVALKEALDWLYTDLSVKYKLVNNYVILTSAKTTLQKDNVSNGSVTGKVVDETRQPLAGATIRVLETDNSAVASSDGSFRFSLAPGLYTLEVSFLTFQSEVVKRVQVTEGQTTAANITLKAAANSLNEVVVTALGIKKREKALGYAIAQISSQDVSNVPQPNVLNALSARVPGVNVRSTGSDAGSSVMVTIRGQSSLTKDNQPLYVIDGVPVAPALQNPTAGIDGKQTIDFGSPIADVSADDIESITILKGASAAALYGSRAGFGVVLITTKSGAAKKGLGISFNSSATFDKAYLFPKFQHEYGTGDWAGTTSTASGDGWGPRLNQGTKYVQWNSPVDDSGKPVPSDWISYPNRVKDFFNTGRTFTNNIAVSKSGEAGDFRLSYGNMINKGIVPNTDIMKNSLTFSGDYNMKKWIRLGSNIAYANNQSDNRPSAYSESVTSVVYKLPANVNIKDLRNYWVPGKEGVQQYNPTSTDDNPYLIAYEETNAFNRNRLTGHVQLSVDLMPQLTLMGRTGLDYYTSDQDEKRPFSAKRNPTGAYLIQNDYFKEQNTDFLLTYHPIEKTDISVSLSAGGNQMDQKTRMVRNYTGSLTLPGIYNLSNAAAGSMQFAQGSGHKRINSLYGLGEFGYKQAVFLSLTARNDWSSTLPSGNNSYFYPSASLSIIASDLAGVKWTPLSYLKLRGNISQVGSDTDPYQLYNTIPFDSDWGSIKRASLIFDQKNSQLKPEIATSYEAGFDVSFFRDRLGANFTWYKTNNKNQIIQVPASIASGANTKLINAGNIQNSGLEFTLYAVPFKGRFTWRTDVNFSRNRNKVIELTEGITNYMLGSTDGSNVQYLIKEGTQMGDFYTRSWMKVPEGPYAGEPLLTNKGMLQQSTEFEKIGNYNPDFMIGFNNSFSFGPLSFSALIDWRKGGKYYSYVAKSLLSAGLVESTLEGRDAAHGGLSWTDANGNKRDDGMLMSGVIANADGSYRPNDVIISVADYYDNKHWKYYENETYDATYVKLKEVSLSYTFSKRITGSLPVSNLSLSVIGYNLYTWTKADNGFDPETTMSLSSLRYQGVGHWTLPGIRSYGFKLSCNF